MVDHKKVTLDMLEEKCLQALEDEGRLNDITRVIVDNIIALQETAIECKDAIDKYGVMIETLSSTGNPILKRNEAVQMQDKAVTSMAKLLAQIGLDNLVEEFESEI